MAGNKDGLSVWEKMNIFAGIVASLVVITLGDVLLTIYQDHNNGNQAGVSFTIAIVLVVVLLVCILFIWLSVRHMKKASHNTWVTFSDMFGFFFPFLQAKEDRDSYCADVALRNSNLWKRFGARWKRETLCWGVFWSGFVIYLCVDIYQYYNNPYDLSNNWIGRVRVFYDTEYVLNACYLRLVIAAIFLLVAVAVFCNTRDYIGEWSFWCWMREFNVSCEELDCEFSEAVYCGNYVWCGERFLFARGEIDGWIIPYEKIKRIEVKRTYKVFFDYIKLPQWTLLFTNEKGEELGISVFRAKSFQKVMKVWEEK